MNLKGLYYDCKPIIPRRLQIAARRWIASRKRIKHAGVWPIDPAAARRPENWAGWPEGKRFALVLSHDVETAKGYKDVLKLAALEAQLGFRSSFNFVPERYGKISLELLDELRRRGFGVGVHGLKHDGKLFLSRLHFERQAKRINAYLKQWKTEGFTSPSMHHNLDWMSALRIEYSTSTFDTDPFEPQPDAVGTIFPIWVANGGMGGGFVELPYTLPQDSTLFIILRERGIGIWKRKLDWIVENGGMALLNTHPDYMDFDGNGAVDSSYPVKHFMDFLEYAKRRYTGQYLNPLPSAIAAHRRLSSGCIGISRLPALTTDDGRAGSELGQSDIPSSLPASRDRRRDLRVAMLTYSFYESDNRVRRYAEALVRRGDQVDVISLRRAGQGVYNELNGVRVYRIQERVRDEKGKLSYLSRISKFFFRSAALLTRKHLERPYDLVHAHSVPDFEVFSALVPKLTGVKIILDIHDIVPELYANKFQISRKSIVFKSLVLVEQTSAKFSDHVIISNDLWKKTLCSRSVSDDRCTAILNYPDEHIFFKEFPKNGNGRFVFLYPGTLNYHQGLDLAVHAFNKIKDEASHADLHIIGEGPAREQLETMIRDVGLQDRVFLKEAIALDKIVKVMGAADAGIIPKRNDDFGGEAFSTKSLEFMSLGVPIIVSRTKIDRYYFDDSVVRFFEPEDMNDLAEAMLTMVRDKELRDKLVANGLEFARNYRWGDKKSFYFDLVDSLCR